MSNEDLLKSHILSEYKSVREFCLANDFAYSTVSSIFRADIRCCVGGIGMFLTASMVKKWLKTPPHKKQAGRISPSGLCYILATCLAASSHTKLLYSPRASAAFSLARLISPFSLCCSTARAVTKQFQTRTHPLYIRRRRVRGRDLSVITTKQKQPPR